MSSKPLIGVQWLRAAAALLVVVDHSLFTLIEKAGADPSLAQPAAHLGGVGVKLFFLISGLVMVFSSTHAFGFAAARDFMRRRLIRIVPLYWLTTVIYLSKQKLTGIDVAWTDVGKSFLFIPFLSASGEMQPVYGLGWTLNYEIFFYVVFSMGLLWSPWATLLGTASVLGGLVLAGAPIAIGPANDLWYQAFYFWSRPITLFFVGGMLLAFALLRWGHLFKAVRISLGGAILVAATMIGFAAMLTYALKLSTSAELVLFALPVLVVSVGSASPQAGGLATVAKRLGDASYSIYLTHPFVIGPLARIGAKLGFVTPTVFVILSVVLTTAIGLLTFQWIERPVLRWFNSRAEARSLAPSLSRSPG